MLVACTIISRFKCRKCFCNDDGGGLNFHLEVISSSRSTVWHDCYFETTDGGSFLSNHWPDPILK